MKTWRWLLSGMVFVACVSIWFVQRNQISGKTNISYEALQGDLDGDDDIDVLLTSGADGINSANTLWINQGGLQGNSQGKFIASIQNLGNHTSHSAALGDLDGDGDLDIVFTSTNGFEVYLNSGGPQGGWQGNYQLQYSQTYPNQDNELWQTVLGDLDRDGDLDALFSGCCREPARTSIWFNDGKGLFTEGGFVFAKAGAHQISLGDLDGDHDLDGWVILEKPESNSSDRSGDYPSSQVWINDGSGHFEYSGQPLGEGTAQAVALGDLDDDGDLDACTSDQGTTTIWINDSKGQFSRGEQMTGQLVAQLVILGDLDQDKDLDVLLSSGDFVEIWINQGRAAFERSDQRIDLQKYSAVALGDFDGDGDLDLFSSYLNDRYRIWWNDGYGRLGLSWR